MGIVSRGFGARRRESSAELPPGQFLTTDFPVLSAGPTPNIDTSTWEFTIRNIGEETHTWSWDQLMAMPIETIDTDIHCVTRWSKLGTTWRGVSLDTLLAGIDTEYKYTMVYSYGSYTTNVPLADLTGGKAWIAFEFDGKPLHPEHGGPARLLVPHLYFWKSAKWVQGVVLHSNDDPGFWEQNGYHLYGDPWKEQRYW